MTPVPDDLVGQVMGQVPPADWRTITVITGPAGIGRTHALRCVRVAARDAGLATVGVRLSPPERTVALHLVSRLAAELDAFAGAGEPDCPRPHRLPTSERTQAAGLVRHIAAAVDRATSTSRRLVVLVDDLHWVDPPSLAILASLVRVLAGCRVSVVCTVRTPVSFGPLAARRGLPDELAADGIGAVRRLRPMSIRQADALVAGLVRVRPHRGFSHYLAGLCRGRPAAIEVAVESYRRSGSLRIVEHRCDSADPAGRRQPPELAGVPGADRLIDTVRELPATAATVARALAVLHPFGSAIAWLLETELGMDRIRVVAALDTLVVAGVLREDRVRGGWRFSVPLVAHALRADLGPYERRRLAQAAVGAAWKNGSRPAAGSYLADELVQARGLVDPERASRELLAHGVSAILADPGGAARWLSSAAESTGDRTRRRYALFGHTVASVLDGDHVAAVRGARLLADEYAGQLSSDEERELQLSYLLGLSGIGDTAELGRIAAGAAPLPGGPPASAAIPGMALCLIGRWSEAETLLAAAQSRMFGTVERECIGLIRCCAAAMLGRSADLLAVASRPGGPACPCRHHVGAVVQTLAVLGDAAHAERVLADQGLPATALPLLDQALLGWRRGRWDGALDHGLRSIAARAWIGCSAGNAAVHQAVASILVSRGRPGRARALLTAARTPDIPTRHVLDAADAGIDRVLGAAVEAERKVLAALALSRRHGILSGTSELWLLGAELAIERGDREEALSRLSRVSGPVPAGADGIAGQDATETIREALRSARTLEQPYQLARTLETIVRAGGEPAMLSEAYVLYGKLDAIVDRYRVRTLMREREMAVPDRQATAGENERIVATLVADGLSNREIAASLRTSEKSVEGRLTRMFARTGYRSRVELATAVLTGDYQPG